MAKYQVKAVLNAPSEEGYTQTTDPQAYADYQILLLAVEHNKNEILEYVLNNYRYEGGPIEEHNSDKDIIIEYNNDGFILLEKIGIDYKDKLYQANENIAKLVNRVVGFATLDCHNCFKVTLFNEDRDCPEDMSCGHCNYLAKERYREMLLDKYIVK